MLAVMALEDHGLAADAERPVLVTGAAGGVGSVAVTLLAVRGNKVAAVTGRPEAADYLIGLGATRIVPREEIAEASKRPLESEAWAGAIDSVGGEMLARLLGQIEYGGSVAAVGVAGGPSFPGSVFPFILRGVNLLGIDSVMKPFEVRQRAWARIASDLPFDKLDAMTNVATLADLPRLGADILKGQVRGRVVIDVNKSKD
jgi:acrylyl-CoA reductase (NADPH)